MVKELPGGDGLHHLGDAAIVVRMGVGIQVVVNPFHPLLLEVLDNGGRVPRFPTVDD